ncbi:hypothetical protein TraAM80_03692 [Trypanosoma rangeli]|uniref:Stress-response A/B barrel domain-containing protein n=1 Tax=Trypanosoma rangeli TaxID=5698 RepID=A0A3R7NRY9_TRYRA|nr:uncharacterized protein TraAM80_03692 [Trypanosoma rangeli]RNF06771.1 hypothetical protein TraAM80_03692 [Trypanosoma rangeli]|eukprot:RNF06771.1 hypothetical protein TraAM80_03692 [Trypanosoma rangeli]
MRVVLFQLRDGMDEDKLESLLLAARSEIPGVVDMHFGGNKVHLTKYGDALKSKYTHVLISRHEREEFLREYISHPRYRDITQYIVSFSTAPATAVNFYANGRPHL